ncbi:hypothetical protein [Thalassobellus sediminis]|uniref:hypothetical protein n=1 Tax=Thalassobellus sediminis TaxID=3367753 RepID=UPI003789469E
MKNYKLIFLIILTFYFSNLQAQEQGKSDSDYIEFNDRKNTVHGVYVGLGMYSGKIHGADTYLADFKIAYVANQQFEVGFVGVGFYSDLNKRGLDFNNRDLVGAYGGLHLEPILFGKSLLSVSFPVLIGGGGIVLLDENDIEDVEIEDDEWQAVFVVEPGINVLFNLSRYVQLEAGVKYRFSSKIDLNPDYDFNNINGFSAGVGIKIGVFNMGRNRYKKNITDEN